MRGALALSAALALTATSGLAVTAQDEEMSDKGLICVIVPGLENPFFASIQAIAADRAEELGYETLRLVHNEDANAQFEHFETCIAQGAKAIILDNAGADATVAAVQAAADAGIGSFLVDREITESGVAISQLTSNNFQGAVLLAEYFAELMGGEGDYIELTGRDTDTNAHVRSDGYHEVLDSFEGLNMVGQQTANWSQPEGFAVTEQLLQTPEAANVKGIIAGNDTMALGAQAAIEAAGRDDIIVVGFDGSDEAIQSIYQGALKATSLQPLATMAITAAEQADAWITDGTVPEQEKASIDMVLLTPENACEYFQYAPVDPAANSNCPAG
jgi:erythritol transport system substrate-binding protein